jgi:NADH-dependent peroxiredoxin subunit F
MDIVYDLIIIGAGPAGITAGIYAARHNLKTLLVTKGFGGQMAKKTVAIENYTGFEEITGSELIQRFEKHLKKQKIEVKIGEIAKLEKTDNIFSVFTIKEDKFLAKAVILATGAEPRTLDVPGEKEFIGLGVSYCVACDGPIFSQKTVAIAGGGNSAFEAALFLAGIARKIYILERGQQMKADIILQEKVRVLSDIEIVTGAAIKEICGDKFVKYLIYQDLKTGQLKTIQLEGVFIEIGHQPEVSYVKNLVELTEKNEVVVDLKNNQTKIAGLFAAGDATCAQYKQIIISAGDGAKAALSALSYIKSATIKI